MPHILSQKLVNLVNLTQLAAKQRIPTHLRDTHPYSVNALWTFYLDTEHQPEGPSCIYCKMFDGQTFTGDTLRTTFPDHKWMGDDIYANVHMTLWGKDGTCGCLLIREDEKWSRPMDLSFWTDIGTDWTELPKEENNQISEQKVTVEEVGEI